MAPKPLMHHPQAEIGARRVLLTLLAGLACAIAVAKGSAQVQVPSADHRLSDLYFVDHRVGWVVGEEDGHLVLLRTTDGGRVWHLLRPKWPIYKIHFLDSRLGWGLSADLGDARRPVIHLLRTEDGGESWSRISSISTSGVAIVKEFLFLTPSDGFFIAEMIDGSGALIRTADAGKTFERVVFPLGGGGQIRGVTSYEAQVWAFGDNSLFYSKDRGQHWSSALQHDSLPEGRLVELTSGWAFPSGKAVFVGVSGGAIVLTGDSYSGKWHVSLQDQKINDLSHVSFWDGKHGCTVGAADYLYCTSDGGVSWRPTGIVPPTRKDGYNPSLERVLITREGRGWVLGGGGFAYETEDFGQTWREVDLVSSSVLGSTRSLADGWPTLGCTGTPPRVPHSFAQRRVGKGGRSHAVPPTEQTSLSRADRPTPPSVSTATVPHVCANALRRKRRDYDPRHTAPASNRKKEKGVLAPPPRPILLLRLQLG